MTKPRVRKPYVRKTPYRKKSSDLPPKAPNALRTTGEVCLETGLPKHTLHLLEDYYPLVPLRGKAMNGKREGDRLYTPEHRALIRRICELRYVQGYTVKGAQRIIREEYPDADYSGQRDNAIPSGS